MTLAHFGFSIEIEDLRDICADPNDCYTLDVEDSFGDGMCCIFGQGEYTLFFNGANTFISDGRFGTNQIVQFGGSSCPMGDTAFKGAPITESDWNLTGPYLRAIPNPTQGNTTFEIGMVEPGQVRLEVFNLHGQRVALLLDEELQQGVHSVNFDASQLNSGIYLFRLFMADRAIDGKLVVQH